MNIEHILPNEIENRSFEIIDEELKARGLAVPESTGFIVKRAIHTTADFDYAHTLCFSDGAVERILGLLASGAVIVTDTNMALSGINKNALNSLGCEAFCFMADEDVISLAKERGVTRALVSMEKAAAIEKTKKKPVIFAVGNAPTALIGLREMYLSGTFTPAAVIGVPVGFVNVEAAKELIMESGLTFVVNRGRKGGSNVAAAIVNAFLYKLTREKR